MVKISAVIPLFNEEKIIPLLLDRTAESLKKITDDFEIICVDDGSSDSTLSELLEYRKKEPRVKAIELSRNFGHQAAYTAGLEYSKSGFVVMMDGDLQDPPELIPEMYRKLTEEDFDIIYGKRKTRKEKLPKRLSIRIFHKFFRHSTKLKAPENVGNFSIMNRKALDALLKLREKNRYLPGLRYYIGFNQGEVEYDRPDREIGQAKMNVFKLTRLAFDAIFSFSKLPIKLSLVIGMIGIFISLVGAGVVIYKKIIGDAVTGWTSTMLGMFFFGSVQLFFLGILGEYIFRIFIETKDRPNYFIKDIYE
ncbi:MAG: hypothetical protein A2W91_18795 [Bacteroidetes bacterium GWF2_38_335]|nr:MAG: hypothetical protein A2W91_18795 [Bacteroidetes bacterium GWF2_38_335]OFY78152.1 MAG: hypothetical protein A2281_04270 [Bacteroidetes bacterium RIFOXYA12_FULL_38_20]HBS88691.1 glycosyltransferase [Bacteroidales bacterium]